MPDMANPTSYVTKPVIQLMFELVSLSNIDTKAATQNIFFPLLLRNCSIIGLTCCPNTKIPNL